MSIRGDPFQDMMNAKNEWTGCGDSMMAVIFGNGMTALSLAFYLHQYSNCDVLLMTQQKKNKGMASKILTSPEYCKP